MATVLIPDYLGKQMVAGARDLTRSGDQVLFTYWNIVWHTRLFRSRAVSELISCPHAHSNPTGYISHLIELVREKQIEVVIPFGLETYSTLVENYNPEMGSLPALLPSADTFNLLNDKSSAANFVQNLGIDVPHSFQGVMENDLGDIFNSFQLPLVLKITKGSGVATGLRYANNLDELKIGFADLMEGQNGNCEIMIQEFIPGFIHDACTVSVKGNPIQIVTQIRKLMYPIYGGVGAINVTTHDEILTNIARKILEASEWDGPAQIEFKKDSRDGRYKFIEFNPKFWGTTELSIKAGVPFPALIRDVVLGRPLPKEIPYQEGVRFNFWMPLGVFAYIQLYREFGWRAFNRVSNYDKQYHDFDWRDPMPWIGAAIGAASTLLRGRLVEVNKNIPKEFIIGPNYW